MTRDLGGAKIYLKREDLNHMGAHKINNVLGQALLAKKMGKTRLIAPPPSAHRPRPPKKGAALPPYSKKRGTRLPIFFWKNALSYFCFFSSSSLSSRSQTPSMY